MTWSSAGPTLTLVIGFGLGLAGESWRDRRATRRSRAERLGQFEFETCIELQDVLSDLFRASARLAQLGSRYYDTSAGGPYADELTQVSANYSQRRTRALVLASRLRRIDVRDSTERCIEAIRGYQGSVGPLDEPPPSAEWSRVDDQLTSTVELLGDSARRLL